MGKFHLFDIDVAEQYGVNAAILLYNISHWIDKNKANGKNYHDGEYWTYNSREAFLKLFPYMTDWQVRSALQTLIDNGILKVGNYNQMPYDRTKWYSLSDKGKSICDNRKFDLMNTENPLDKNDSSIGDILQPIPDIKPNIKPDNNTVETFSQKKKSSRRKAAVSDDVEELFEILWRLYPRKEGKRKVTNDAKNALAKAGYDKVAAAIEAYKEQIERNNTDDRYVKHGSTFFNGDWMDYVAENNTSIKGAQDYVNGGFESY